VPNTRACSAKTGPQKEAATGLGDIDFCLELLHSDIINVTYILELIADLGPYSEGYLKEL